MTAFFEMPGDLPEDTGYNTEPADSLAGGCYLSHTDEMDKEADRVRAERAQAVRKASTAFFLNR